MRISESVFPWDLDRNYGGVTVLPPYEKSTSSEWYSGTANAIYQNLDYMEQFDPDYVLILSGDHIYKMDYEVMLDYHKANNADVTIAAMPVPMEEASRLVLLSQMKMEGFRNFRKNLRNQRVIWHLWEFIYFMESPEGSVGDIEGRAWL